MVTLSKLKDGIFLIQLVDKDDVKKKMVKNIKREEKVTSKIPLVGPEDVIDESKAAKIDKREKIVIKEKAKQNKKYHLLRWKIKSFLIRENIIISCVNWETILDVFNPEMLNRDDLTDVEIEKIFIKYGFELVEHHTKYRDIHGIDETMWMTPSEHRNLHNRLRREGKCNVSSEELEKISRETRHRGDRHKDQIIRHTKKWYLTEEGKDYCVDRAKKLKNNWIIFHETLAPNIRLHETIVYYDKTGTLTVSSGFVGDHGIKPLVVQID